MEQKNKCKDKNIKTKEKLTPDVNKSLEHMIKIRNVFVSNEEEENGLTFFLGELKKREKHETADRDNNNKLGGKRVKHGRGRDGEIQEKEMKKKIRANAKEKKNTRKYDD